MRPALPRWRQIRKRPFLVVVLLGLGLAIPGASALWQWQQNTLAPRERFFQTTQSLLALSPRDVNGALSLILTLPDPIERYFAVDLWIKQNRGRVDPAQGSRLCGILPDEERSPCARRLSASHLRR
jgi:hypothetical protein